MPGLKRNGQVMLELALVLPVLLVLIMGVMQYGAINNATIALSQLSREGARYAATHARDNNNGTDADTKIKDYVKRSAQSTVIDPADLDTVTDPDNGQSIEAITITPGMTPPNQRLKGGEITVTIRYAMQKKFFLPSSFPGLSRIKIHKSECTMRIEN